jgi:hypothetical protein
MKPMRNMNWNMDKEEALSWSSFPFMSFIGFMSSC